MQELRLKRITEVKAGEPIAVGDRKLIPLVRLQNLMSVDSDNPYCYRTVEPLAIIVVDSTGKYLLSLSGDIPSLQEAYKKVPDLDSHLAHL